MKRKTVTYAGITVPVLGRGTIGYPACDCGKRIIAIQRDTRGNRYVLHGFDPDAMRALRCRVSLREYAQLAEHFAEVYRRAARAARLDAIRQQRRSTST